LKRGYNLHKKTFMSPYIYARISDFWKAKKEAANSYETTRHHIKANINHHRRHNFEFIFLAVVTDHALHV